jgi:hypothetical protein
MKKAGFIMRHYSVMPLHGKHGIFGRFGILHDA